MSATKMFANMRLTVCLFAIALGVLATAQTPAVNAEANPNPGLVNQLTSQLNISPEQAIGGAGAIFGLAKSRLRPGQFSNLAAAVPGMDGFLKAAPAQQGGSSMNSLASLGSIAPGGAKATGGAGGIASLAGSFQSLGLSPAMVSKFAPVLENYVQKRGGSKTAALLTGVLQ